MAFRGAAILALAASLEAQVTAITGARVFDGTGKPAIPATVILRGDRIAAVGANLETPAGARVVRGDGATLLPGLFDIHTHLPYGAAPVFWGDWPKNLKAYLYCGVTSVVDFGLYPEMFEPMRRLLREGVVPGPNIHMAARITTPGGHGAEAGRGDFHTLAALTAAEARAAARRWLAYKPDSLKVFTDGWRYGAAGDMTSMEEAPLRAIVEEAHAGSVTVFTHTVTLAKAKIAARAGVDGLVHGIGDAPVDAEFVNLARKQDITYAPTLAVYEPRVLPQIPPLLAALMEPSLRREAARRGTHPPAVLRSPSRLARWEKLRQNTATLRGAGIRIAAGTDSGVTGTYHGWAALREVQLLVASGLTPGEALAAATGNSARAIHVDKDRGLIAPGMRADLLLVDGAPDQNIADIERTRAVWRNGQLVDRAALLAAFDSDEPAPIPSLPARPLIDDLESADGRTRADTLAVNFTDEGHDHSQMSFGRILRSSGDHALAIQATMSQKKDALAGVSLPLRPGAVEPVDAGSFQGLEFEARGEGSYRLRIPTLGVRDGAYFGASFAAGPQWSVVRVPFSRMQRSGPLPAAWTGRDLLAIQFAIQRPPGEFAWLEIDNVRFY